MGSEWGEFWRRILRFSWFGHQSLFDLIPTFVVPCMTGHLVSVDMVCSFLPSSIKFDQKNRDDLRTHLDFLFAPSPPAALANGRQFIPRPHPTTLNGWRAAERTSCR